MDSSRAGISKKRPQAALSIPESAFEEASRLDVGMQFENWEHLNLVLMAYGKQTGFIWQIENKYPDNNGGVYKYVFECRHAGKFQPKQKISDPSQQHNQKSVKTKCTCFVNICWPLSSPGPVITKLNLTHYGHALNPDIAVFANVYRQFSQNIMDKIEGDIMNSEQDPENDASNLLQTLRKMRDDDPTWFIAEHC
ncbi:19768_t:CDS:2, partial [Gigaspora rosea]